MLITVTTSTMSSIFCANCGHPSANDIELPATPVPDLLGGHYVASPLQERLISDAISAAQATIIQFDDQIIHLQVVMDRLIQKRDAVRTYKNLHMALIAPIRRLPPEVLSEIFINSSNLPGERDLTPQLDKTPLLLGSICSRWRSISLSTPRLWASFTLTIRPKYQKNDAVLANTWLARAGTCPLYISLGSLGNYQNTMRPLMQVFARYCEYWYDIHLSLPLHVLRSLSAVKNRLPRLQRLHLDCLDESVDIFESAPQLHCFHQDWPMKQSIVKVPWNQLREFSTGWCNVDDYLAFLRLAPNLEVLVALLASLEPRHPHSLIQLPHLHSLSIHGNIAYTLDRLMLPKLRGISIDTQRMKWTATPQLTSILSQCSIESLSFDTGVHLISDDNMIQMLQMCPSLLKIDLFGSSSYCMTKSFFSKLAYHGDSDIPTTMLVPRLHTITVDYVPSYFDMLDFVDAIQSRVVLGGEGRLESEVTRLKTVEIRHFRGILEPIMLSRLRQLKAMGLDIRVLLERKDIL